MVEAESSPSTSNNKVSTGLAIVITGAWAVSFIVDIVNKNYDPPASVHGLMMMVAGAVFGEGLIRTRNGPSASKKERDDGTG